MDKKKMNKQAFFFWGGLTLAAIASGLGWTAYQVKRADTGAVAAGPWKVSVLAGSPDADAVTRARVAVGGLLALGHEETVYYVARTDSAGKDLRSRCEYRIEGLKPDARWWSITAYADDLFLFADAKNRFSANGSTIPVDAQGRFVALTSPSDITKDGQVPHMQTPGDRGMVLTLRLYNPSLEIQKNPAALVAPRIEAVGVCS